MTSRTPMGVQPRQPQRTLSSPSLSSQRPAPSQRIISQQHLPSSPVRKESSFGDFSASDWSDALQSRHGISTPRRGGSRLRLELSSDHGFGSQVAAESPQSFASARPLQATDGLDAANSPALSRASHQDTDNPPMPMPRRPQLTTARTPAPRRPAPAPPAAKKDNRPKPYTFEEPREAPRLPTKNRNEHRTSDPFGKGLFSGRADFYPWKGKHLEDGWTNESIGKGVWEKYSSSESSSARLAIFPALKQKTGLNALSTIFMGVLNQRRQRGQVNTPSTFKPPPRVTLTDTKREVWLRDLANPATSLRRLSRTIPHGIRGRALLDQCLNKNVPTERAVWLAKCVGANEIRAFKRKGVNGAIVMGGEIKWCKDWTVFVEQFVDSVVSATNEDGWKAKATYAIRLATSLYSENLLDRDHYLDWVISGLEGSAQGRLPMCMLIVRIYWADLLRSRKYGRRLVAALLSHVHSIHSDPDRDILSQLSSQLSIMLASLIKSNPESFIYTSAWTRYRDTLRAVLPSDDEVARKAYSRINSRNLRLAVAGNSYPPAGRQRLVKLLDSAFQNSIEADLPAKCWAASDDKVQLVKTLVEWATSVHRPGLAKVYMTSRLLKNFKAWSTAAPLDATTAVLEALDGIEADDQNRKSHMYHLVAELIRDRIFSVPQYLQWLIARGGYHDESEVDPEFGPCAARLLIEIPVDSLPMRLKTERANLLHRAGDYSVAAEEVDMSNGLKCVRQTLGLPLAPDDPLNQRNPMPMRKLLARLRNSSRALKCAISSHLREVMVQQGSGGGNQHASVAMLTSVRTILETTEDFTMLSEVVQCCLKSSDAEILAACADTINANLPIFLALGSAPESFNLLIERLRMFGQQGAVPRPLLAAVCHLAQRMPGRAEVANQLRQDLLQSDRSNAIDACSPVSDSMVPQAQAGDGELSEEIDKLLATGNRIDHPTMNRLFRTIVPRLEAGWAKGDESCRAFASLLTKMRVFDTRHFDKLMSDWISHVRSLPKRPPLPDLYPLLVTAGCLTVSALLHTANASPPITSNPPSNVESTDGSSATYLQELLALFLTKLPKTTSLTQDEVYRFHIYQEAAKSDNAAALLTLIRNTIAEYAALHGQQTGLSLPLDSDTFRDRVLDALRLLVVADAPAASEALSVKDLPQGATCLVSTMTTKLLLPGAAEDSPISFDQILGLATELTLPFCQLKLEFDLSVNESNPSASEDPTQSRFDLFSSAMDRAIEANNITWTSMLPCLSGDISQHLKGLALGRLITLIPSLKSRQASDAVSDDHIHLAENLLGVIEAITTGQTPANSPQLTSSLVDKLCDLCEIVAAKDRELDDVRASVLEHWLPAVLRLIILQGKGSDSAWPAGLTAGSKPSAPVNHEARGRIVIALCSLLLELQRLPAEAVGDLAQQVFDVAILLVDDLPDDLRQQCAKNILLLPGSSTSTTLSSDPRLYYLLSTPQLTPADNLILSHRDKSASLQSSGPRGMGAMYGIAPPIQERLAPFAMRRWEMLSESTPNVGENDTSLSLGLFEAIKIQ